MRTHQLPKLLTNPLQRTESVILRESHQEVLHDIALVGTSDLLQFLHDLLLVAGGEGRRAQDPGEFAVLLQDFAEGGERLGGLFESGRLGGCSVLFRPRERAAC